MLVRVRDCGAAYGHLFPESGARRAKFAEVAASVQELDSHALTHMTASVAATANQKAKARRALARALKAINATARVVAVVMTCPKSDTRIVKVLAGEHVRLHGISHTAITQAIEGAAQNRMSIDVVRQFSRHRSLNTLMIYRALHDNKQGVLAQLVSGRLTTKRGT